MQGRSCMFGAIGLWKLHFVVVGTYVTWAETWWCPFELVLMLTSFSDPTRSPTIMRNMNNLICRVWQFASPHEFTRANPEKQIASPVLTIHKLPSFIAGGLLLMASRSSLSWRNSSSNNSDCGLEGLQPTQNLQGTFGTAASIWNSPQVMWSRFPLDYLPDPSSGLQGV